MILKICFGIVNNVFGIVFIAIAGKEGEGTARSLNMERLRADRLPPYIQITIYLHTQSIRMSTNESK